MKVFEGWYTSETDGTKVEDLTVYKNTNLYARWSTYTSFKPLSDMKGVFTVTETANAENSVSFSVNFTSAFQNAEYAVYSVKEDNTYTELSAVDGIYTAEKEYGTKILLSTQFEKFIINGDDKNKLSGASDANKPAGAVIIPEVFGEDGIWRKFDFLGYYGENTDITAVAIPAAAINNAADANAGYNFSGCTNLAVVVFGEGYRSVISNSMFKGCTALKTLDIPAVSAIYASAFSGSGLTAFEMPASVEKLGDEVFKDCAALTSVSFSKNEKITVLPAGTFRNCVKFITVELPSKLEEIDGLAFSKCEVLEELNIPASLKLLTKGSSNGGDGNIFEHCKKLKTIIMNGNVPTVEKINPYWTFGANGTAGKDFEMLTIYVPDEYFEAYKTYTYEYAKNNNWHFWLGHKIGTSIYAPKMSSDGSSLKKISEMPNQ